jgi:S1-C subfamily serine protease
VTLVDWIALAVVALAALNGFRRGLVVGALSLAGLAAGAYLGARLAPQVLDQESSPYTPLVALGGAITVAFLFQAVAGIAGGFARGSLVAVPPLRALDSAGGLVLGAATGIAFVWVVGAVALHLPGQTELRREVQSSTILRRLNREFPPERLMDAIARVDPFGAIAGPDAGVAAPDPRLLQDPGVRRAAGSVLRVTGTACGLGVQGSGWIARPELVVTNAHVVAGVRDVSVDRHDDRGLDGRVVHIDTKNDVAVIHVPGLAGRPLSLAPAEPGVPVVVLGYPLNGRLTATPGRVGRTATVLTDDALGRGPVTRSVTTLRAVVRHGNSGGPVVDRAGRVRTVVFASRRGADGGYGVPTAVVQRALDGAGTSAVSTGPCTR